MATLLLNGGSSRHPWSPAAEQYLTSLGLSATGFAAIAVALAYMPDLTLPAIASPALLVTYGAALFTFGALIRRRTTVHSE